MVSPVRSPEADAPSADPALLAEAVALAKAAGERTLRWFRADDLAVEAKGDGTPVTEADKDAESFLRAELAGRHPDDAVIGEEEGEASGTSDRTWVIDPIDGTKAFMRGVPLYSNLLAVRDQHGWAIGVINLPAIGECIYAGRGLGCWQDHRGGQKRPARVRPGGRPGADASTAGIGGTRGFLLSSGFTHWDDDMLLRVKQAGWALRTWGDAYGYSLVATGRAEAMVDPTAAVWDLAPMATIVPEAGGRFSAIDGRPGPEWGSGVATAAGHDELLALLQG